VSDQPQALEQAHATEHPHPTALRYIQIAVVLALITAGEVAVYYIEALASLLPILLIGLSALKFGLVAAFYMHLKFDSRLFTGFFVGGLLLAGSVVLAIMTLFGVWTHVPGVQATVHH
jgi:cytochrome c oxidase subunit IV